jgi:hypothetical protein
VTATQVRLRAALDVFVTAFCADAQPDQRALLEVFEMLDADLLDALPPATYSGDLDSLRRPKISEHN